MALSACLFLLAAATAFTAGDTNAAAPAAATNTTITATGGGNFSALSTMADYPDTYICYLCSGRNPMLIKWCPIDVDHCHLYCSEPATANTTAAAAEPLSPMAPVSDDNYNNCYVMKLYNDGSYVIVDDHINCAKTASCVLLCGKGDAARTITAAPDNAGGPRPLPNFQRCGDQFIAPSAAVPGE